MTLDEALDRVATDEAATKDFVMRMSKKPEVKRRMLMCLLIFLLSACNVPLKKW
jgi:hypothetical protein